MVGEKGKGEAEAREGSVRAHGGQRRTNGREGNGRVDEYKVAQNGASEI